MTPRSNAQRQRDRRIHEKAWLTAHGFTSWEKLHTLLMDGEIFLDRVTPAYNKPDILSQAVSRLQPEVSQLADALISRKKKGSRS